MIIFVAILIKITITDGSIELNFVSKYIDRLYIYIGRCFGRILDFLRNLGRAGTDGEPGEGAGGGP